MNITIRPARPADREPLIIVEAGATPNLSYVGHVFEMFLTDPQGEFCIAEVENGTEVDNQAKVKKNVVACGKFTLLPDGSAWLETIRVLPGYQGRGIGKRFYERFFEVADAQNVTTLRMYTGTRNVVSKGLAERFGFQVAEKFQGAWRSAFDAPNRPLPEFRQVTEPNQVSELLLTQADQWGGYLVMNRTFYKVTPELCVYLVKNGQVYYAPKDGRILVAGARFMPEAALHIGHFDGSIDNILPYAVQLARAAKSDRLSCLFPSSKIDIQQSLLACGFQLEPSEFLVMERHI